MPGLSLNPLFPDFRRSLASSCWLTFAPIPRFSLYLGTRQSRKIYEAGGISKVVFSGAAQSFANGIVKCGTNLPYSLIFAVRPGSIRQQTNRHIGLQIDPQRAAAVAKMADGPRRK